MSIKVRQSGAVARDGNTTASQTVAVRWKKNKTKKKRTQSISETKPDVTMKGKNVEGNLKGDATS